MLGLLAGLLYGVGRTWLVRSRFMRSRPNRFIAEPQLNDGGTQSLVPSMNPESEEADGAPSGMSWLKTNIHLVEPLKEITIREISAPQSGSNADMPLPPNTAAAMTSTSQERSPISVDPVRVQLQSESLVTLPAPARDDSGSAREKASDDPSNMEGGRSPRDTLTEHELARELGLPWPPARTQPEPSGETDSEHGSAMARQPDPGPEAQFARPLVTFRTTGSSASQEIAPPAGVVRAVQSNESGSNPEDAAQASEIMVVAQPVASLSPEANAPEPVTALDTQHEEPHNVRSGSNEHDVESPKNGAIQHPLAALGLCSQPPRAIAVESAAPPRTEQAAVLPVTESVPPPDTQHSSPTAVASTEPGKPSTQVNAIPSPEEALNNLAGELAARFGSGFEAQVRELAAQRVAQMIAERFMAAFDVNTLMKEPTRVRSSQPAAAVEESTAAKPKRRRRQT
jgi:hypothetical protein